MLCPLAALLWAALGFSAHLQAVALYNGIELPTPWPPKDHVLTLEPPAAPYLASPPAVIPIDVGRQFFVDDFLIEQTTLKRRFHAAEYSTENPILRPDKPWEQARYPTAMVFSDGVWYDPGDKQFKMWYMGGYGASICYATSKDGIHWEKPELDVNPGSNVVFAKSRDSTTVWLDLEEKDPERRYKLFRYDNATGGKGPVQTVHVSRDGIHWKEVAGAKRVSGDRSTVFYNPFRKVWVYNLRDMAAFGGLKEAIRSRRYAECADAVTGAGWTEEQAPLWISVDKLDPRRPELNVQPQLYNLDCVAYESLILGLFSIWPGQPTNRPKPNYIAVGFSRDGFHWDRPTHEPFVPVSERKGDWNWGNMQSAGGCCLVVGDRLYFYVSGRAGVEGSGGSGDCCTGLATLRRDGFASMDADATEGTLTTRPVTFQGKHLFVNADAKEGELRVEVLDRDGRTITPFTRENCVAIHADNTRCAVTWRTDSDLSSLVGQVVRFRFHLQSGRLYSFWVSPERTGASHGYVAAGGPGFTGPTDTVGGSSGQTYQVRWVPGAKLTLDGKASEPVWKEAAVEKRLVFPWKNAPAPETEFRALCDGTNFWFTFRVQDSDIVVLDRLRDEEDEVFEDRVEVYFSRDDEMKNYYCFEVDSRGRAFDYRASYYRHLDTKWNFEGLKTKGSPVPGGYEVEGRVPLKSFAALGFPAIGPGARIRCGLYRAEFSHERSGRRVEQKESLHNLGRKIKGPPPIEEWISWVDPGTKEPDFHVPASLGWLDFVR